MEVMNKKNINTNTDSTSVVSQGEPEESGWTAYFEDMSNYENGSSFISSPSMVSDAAWNGSDRHHAAVSGSDYQVRRLNFKNLKKSQTTNRYFCDEDLEDTASSPVNSPKVANILKDMQVKDDHHDLESAGNFLGNGEDEKNNGNSRNVDLRKKGLCLVPMSTFINYLA